MEVVSSASIAAAFGGCLLNPGLGVCIEGATAIYLANRTKEIEGACLLTLACECHMLS